MADSALRKISRWLTGPEPELALEPVARPAPAKAYPFTGMNAGPAIDRRSINLVGDSLNQFRSGSFDSIYRSQIWVYVAINKIAVAAASLPFKAYQRLESNGRERLGRDAPLSRLLSNPYDSGDSFQLVGDICRDVGKYDHALLVKEYEDGSGSPPTGLWWADWSRVEIVPGETTPIVGFKYQGTSGKTRLFRRDECIHFSMRSGVSPLEPLAHTLILDDAAIRQAIGSYKNGLRPSAWLELLAELTEEQRREIQALLYGYQGVDATGRVPMVPGKVAQIHFAEHQQNAQQAEWVAARKLNREEVAAAFQVDPTQIGILDHGTFNNVTEAHLSFYMDTERPWLTMIEEAFRVQLIEADGLGDQFVEFDMADVLKGNLETRYEALARAILSGWLTRNEARAIENLPPVNDRGADSLYAPINMQALDGSIPSPEGSPVGQPALASLIEGLEQKLDQAEDAKTWRAEREDFDRKLLAALTTIAEKEQPGPEVNVTIPELPAPQVQVDVHPPEQPKRRTVEFSDGRTATLFDE